MTNAAHNALRLIAAALLCAAFAAPAVAETTGALVENPRPGADAAESDLATIIVETPEGRRVFQGAYADAMNEALAYVRLRAEAAGEEGAQAIRGIAEFDPLHELGVTKEEEGADRGWGVRCKMRWPPQCTINLRF